MTRSEEIWVMAKNAKPVKGKKAGCVSPADEAGRSAGGEAVNDPEVAIPRGNGDPSFPRIKLRFTRPFGRPAGLGAAGRVLASVGDILNSVHPPLSQRNPRFWRDGGDSSVARRRALQLDESEGK
jgi:hypothetical protein